MSLDGSRRSAPLRLLWLQHGDFSGINPSLARAWRDVTNVEIIVVDLIEETLREWRDKARAVPIAWRSMGARLLRRGYGGLRGAVKRSAWYAEELATTVDRICATERFDFSISMQSIVPVLEPRAPNFVFTDHTIRCNYGYPDGAAAAERWSAYLPYEEQAIRAATGVFTMSEQARKTVIAQYKVRPDQAICVGGGCHAPIAAAVDPARYERRNVVFVGYDWERKGGPELVEAFRTVRARVPDATLTIVGCSPSIRAPGLEVVGAVPPTAVARYLARATVFCMPSRREPFGLAYLEAMSAGLPVVALRQGAVLDFVIERETGFLVPANDVQMLADRLVVLLSNPDTCRRLGTRGRELVETRYTWEHVQRTMWDVISRSLDRPPAPAS